MQRGHVMENEDPKQNHKDPMQTPWNPSISPGYPKEDIYFNQGGNTFSSSTQHI